MRLQKATVVHLNVHLPMPEIARTFRKDVPLTTVMMMMMMMMMMMTRMRMMMMMMVVVMMMVMMVMCQGRSMKRESCSQPLNSESPRYLCFCGCNTRPQNSFQIRTSGPTLEPACRRKTLLAFRGFRQVSFNFSKSKIHLKHQIAKCAFDVDVTWCCWIVAPTFCYGQSSFLLAGHLIQLARASVSMF